MKTAITIALSLGLALAHAAQARLGETEAQSKARYGEPNPDLTGSNDKPLLPGATEHAFLFQDWRVRAAFVNGTAVRIEYVHVPDGMPKKLTAAEIETILEAENGGRFSWREQKPRTGSKELNALKTLFEGRIWERSDHAEAKLIADLVLVFETRDADRLEKKLAAQAGKSQAKPASKVPGF
ncbi:MAG: hypothetical protein ABI680_11775 [Chthoniobacteraceae bacterium]